MGWLQIEQCGASFSGWWTGAGWFDEGEVEALLMWRAQRFVVNEEGLSTNFRILQDCGEYVAGLRNHKFGSWA